jgi:hypothetical protein
MLQSASGGRYLHIMGRKGRLKVQYGEIKDPHVFPFVVKGLAPGDRDVYVESRRTKDEAMQTWDRYKASGYKVWMFETRVIQETL